MGKKKQEYIYFIYLYIYIKPEQEQIIYFIKTFFISYNIAISSHSIRNFLHTRFIAVHHDSVQPFRWRDSV